MDVETINRRVGGCGIYQYLLFFLMSSFTFKMAVEWQNLSFAIYDTPFQCRPPSDKPNNSIIQVSADQCRYRRVYNRSNSDSQNSSVNSSHSDNIGWMACTSWIYDKSELQSTMIIDFDLVCDKKNYRHMIFTLYYLASLFGSPFVMLADRYGKRNILMGFLFLGLAVTVWQALSWSLWQQMLASFVSGLLKSVSGGLAIIVIIEMMPLKQVDVAATNFWFFYAVGYMSTAGFVYATRQWRVGQLCSMSLCLLYVPCLWLLPETPRWLILRGRKAQAIKVFQMIARINRRAPLRQADLDDWHPLESPTGNFWTLFQSRQMVLRLLVLSFAAWSFSLAYVGSSTDLRFASENIFLTTLVMGAMELPCGPLAAICARKMGRKAATATLSIGGVLGLVSMPFLDGNSNRSPWQPWVKTCLAMVAKLGFTSAWCVIDVINSELLPTNNRNAGFTIIYTLGGIGNLVGPLLNSIALEWHYAAPCMIYAGFLIVTVIMVMVFLPETQGTPLPQTLEQAVALKKGHEEEYKIACNLEPRKRGSIVDKNISTSL